MEDSAEKDLEDLVQILREEPQGVPLKRLSSLFQAKFHRNFKLRALGFNSMAMLVDKVDELVTAPGSSSKKLVFHCENCPWVSKETGGRSRVIENLVNMIWNHKNGYSLKTLPKTYQQKYKRELSVTALGFETMEALVASLSELVVLNNRVYHVTHLGQPQGGAALSSSSSTSSAAATETLTQDQLLQRVMEVMKTYSLDNPSMSRLQSCYLDHFGSELPFAQYLSLYDNWTASQIQTPNVTPAAHTDGTTTTLPTELQSEQNDLEDLVKMVRRFPSGIPLATLKIVFDKTYNRCLSLKALGFSSIENLVVSLSDELFIRDSDVFHKKTAVNAVSIHPEFSSAEQEERFENLIKMLKGRPKGLKLKSLGTVYTQTYNKKMSLTRLGFTTMEALVRSLSTDLFIKGKRAVHVMYKKNTGAAESQESGDSEDEACSTQLQGGLSTAATSLLGSPLFMTTTTPRTALPTASTAPRTPLEPTGPQRRLSTASLSSNSSRSKKLTQDQLLHRVMKVIKIYNLDTPSMARLKSCYLEHFGSELSVSGWLRGKCLSLFDKVEASQSQTQASSFSNADGTTPGQPEAWLGLRAPQPSTCSLLRDSDFPALGATVAKAKDHPPIEPSPKARDPLPTEPPPKARDPLPIQPSPKARDPPPTEPPPKARDPPPIKPSPKARDLPPIKPSPKARDPPLIDSSPKAKSRSVYLDGYYGRLREELGENMRAMEALEAETGGGGGWSWSRSLDPQNVNDIMQGVIRELASEGELVTKEKVTFRSCQLLQIPSLESAGLKHWQIPALKDLQFTIREVNMFLEATESVSSICTLYELGQALAALKDKKRYEELNLGPLCKLPLVHRMFKIHADTKDDDIHHIETVNIIKLLQIYRRNIHGNKIDMADFMKHLADHYNCESPYELGIRIQSIALPIGTLTKVIRGERAAFEKAREQMEKELEEETLERLRRVKKNVLEALPHLGASSAANAELRMNYTRLTAAEVVLAVFTKAESVFSPKMTKHVQTFLLEVSGDRLATALFQLCICGGSLAPPQDLVLKDKNMTNDQTRTEDSLPTPRPSEAAVKQFVRDSLSAQSTLVTLSHMAALEKKVTKNFQLKDFLTLDMGTFLDFLVKHVQLLQDCVGSALVLSSGLNLGDGAFKPSRQDVFEFIKQCGDSDPRDPDQLALTEAALRAHFRLRNCRDLGFGPVHRLSALVQQQRQLSGGGLSAVHYEGALLAKHNGSSLPVGCESVGRLGEMNKDQALLSLLSCPLLEDLGQWSQWDLVFKPLLGSLKDFIERHAGTSGLSAVEVTPGLLLRTTSLTSDQAFSSAAESLDAVGAAGHLVSLVLSYGLTNAPLALLANHMQSALAAAVATQDLSQAHEDEACYRTVTDFLLDCLVRIPIRTCSALMQQVFLEPFGRVLGQTRSKEVLMRAAQSSPQRRNRLHHLGILLGVSEWIRDYHDKLRPRKERHDDHTKLHPPPQRHDDRTSRASTAARPELNDVHSEVSSEVDLSDSEEAEVVDNSVASASPSIQQMNGDDSVRVEEEDEEEEEDDEELYELASAPSVPSIPSVPSTSSSSEEEDSDAEEERSEVSPEQALIDDIRRGEFGVGVALTSEGHKLMQVQQERLGRSLERLSTELYSKDTHFVLELIQNADDNSYEEGVTPALAFVVERDCITILNNETGFQEKNIRAICDVGRSTKGKHTSGYIGQKGIGFKSVFKVTDCPEIHSNGFHLRFDKNCGPMGYILPHWAPEPRAVDPQPQSLSQHSWSTQISLPLRAETQQTRNRNLFHDVHPSLLLFLHRLRSISIYNQMENRWVSMSRKDLSHDVLEVEHTDGTERWLVIKSTLTPPKIKDGVEFTELALAFQLSAEQTGSDVIVQPQKQPVFAYLPLRTFGFRFIIQGDFDIPSSREDVDRDSSWNQWLRSEVPLLFLKAMEVFNSHPDFPGLSGLCHFLQFSPLPDEILDFFKPVALQILQLLKGRACLPTLSSEGSVVFKLPSQVAVCQDPVIRDVIGGEELEKHLSLSYLHPGLSPTPPPSLLRELGVRYLRGPDVTTVTTAMAKELIKMEGVRSEAGVRKLAKLLVCNFRALEHGYGEADSILQTLRELPIIPLSDGRVVALSGEGVFFPMEETAREKKKKGQTHNKGPLSALYQDVCVVEPALLSCMEALENQQVRELLRRLGVHELEPQELLQQHIYPVIQSGRWKSKPETVVVSYLVFIKLHSSSSSLLELSDCAVPVLTTRGLLCPKQSRVYFSEEYGNISLSARLPGYEWVLLSPSYIRADSDVAGWRELFFKLGVRDGFIIRKERRTLTAKELASSPWAVESSRWSESQGCVIDDYPCEEFFSLASAPLSAPLLLQQRRALLELLENNWDSGHHYSQYLTAQVLDGDGRPIKSTNSSFYFQLCRLEWLPAQRPLQSGGEESSFMRPSSVYLSSEEIRGLLGTHVWYVHLQPSDFTRKLGMRETVTVDSLISYLKEWSMGEVQEETEESGETEGAEFTSTVQHIHTVYSYLNKNCSQGSLKELFQHTPAVFVLQQRLSEDWVLGRFFHLKEVCWSDPTSMFLRYRGLTQSPSSPVRDPRVLAPFYSSLEGMKDFFTRLLNVDLSPNIKQYVGLLELVCSSSSPSSELLQDVSVLYATLAHKCKMTGALDFEDSSQPRLNSGYCSTLKAMVSALRVFPTKDNSWVSLSRRPLICDSRELEKIFRAHRDSVCLLQLPPPERKTTAKKSLTNRTGQAVERLAFREEDRDLFLEICGVKRLSSCVSSEAQTESLRPCPSVQETVRSVVPFIQRFLYHREDMNELYGELQDNHIADKIKKLSFRQVGKLYRRYQLDVPERDSIIELEDVICLLKDQKELYIQKDHLGARLDICRELVKLFCSEASQRKELMHFLSGLITSLSDPAALRRFLQKEDVRELPEEEEPWEVPEPPKPPPPPPLPTPPPSLDIEPLKAVTEESPRPPQDSLICWPPRASILNTGAARKAGEGGAVEAVMKMWPPPAPPKDRAYEAGVERPRPGPGLGPQDPESKSSSAEGTQTRRETNVHHPSAPTATTGARNTERLEDSAQAGGDRDDHTPGAPKPPRAPEGTAAAPPSAHPPSGPPPTAENAQQPTEAPPTTENTGATADKPPLGPDVVQVSGTFQGAGDAPRPPVIMDFPQWNSELVMEDITIACAKPSTVVLSDSRDMAAIGEWGERLVHSFLLHWRDSAAPGRPSLVEWCNERGESGQPYDFRLRFGPDHAPSVFVEVKSTVKADKAFIHLSANELDFALRKREFYQIYRVYSAGDEKHVRLCRIHNLAQHLHTKNLELYLFV